MACPANADSLGPTGLRLCERPHVEGVEVDDVDTVRGESACDLGPVLGRMVDRLGEDRRSRPHLCIRLRIAGWPVRQRGLGPEPRVVPGAHRGEAGQFPDRRWRLRLFASWETLE